MNKLYKANIPVNSAQLGAKGKHKNVNFSIEVSAPTLSELHELVEQILIDVEKLPIDKKMKTGNVDFYGPR